MRFDNKGNITLVIIALAITFGFVMIGGFSAWDYTPDPNPTQTYEPVEESNGDADQALQLRKLGYATIPPQPSPTTPPTDSPPTPTPTDRPTTGINPGDPNPPAQPPPSNGPTCDSHAPAPADNSCSCPNSESKGLYCASSCACDTSKMDNDCPIYTDAPGSPITFPSGKSCVFKLSSGGGQRRMGNSDCQVYCWAKPVLYFYPLQPTYYNVSLDIPGYVTVSDPLYPEGGWKDVLAYPNGTLYYQGQKYRDLFYETEVNVQVSPKTGIYIPTIRLEENLRMLTARYGLTPFESQEFMDYWLPELSKIQTPYIFFSVLTWDEKELVDSVNIHPYPDTFIYFLAYFKPAQTIERVEQLEIPTEIPKRIGNTVVEWGGQIDN